jgi:hypothetical protein
MLDQHVLACMANIFGYVWTTGFGMVGQHSQKFQEAIISREFLYFLFDSEEF